MDNTPPDTNIQGHSLFLITIPREIAVTRGFNKYHTGIPCPEGHYSQRYTKSYKCLKCCSMRAKMRRFLDPNIEKIRKKDRESSKKYRKNNPEKVKNSLKNCRNRRLKDRRKACRDWSRRNPEKKRQWRIDNPEKNKAQKLKWYKNNPNKVKAMRQKSYQQESDAQREQRRNWRKNNMGIIRAKNIKRKLAKIQRTPPWLTKTDLLEIRKIYELSADMRIIGINSHVDHIIPLQGKIVSGLHVPENLQIITAKKNMSKGASYHGK